MALRSGGRKLSFDILASSEYDEVLFSISRSSSDPIQNGGVPSPRMNRNKSKRKRNKRKGSKIPDPVSENAISENSLINGEISYSCTASAVTETSIVPETTSTVSRPVQFGELRQRNVSSTMLHESAGSATEDSGAAGKTDDDGKGEIGENQITRDVSTVSRPVHFGELRQRNVSSTMLHESAGSATEDSGTAGKTDDNGKGEIGENQITRDEASSDRPGVMNGRKSEEPVDWNKLMADDPRSMSSMKKSPTKYFLEEMYAGNSLRSTTTVGNDKERERVYDTIFRLPWRCELLIDVGFFVCLDSFLSLLTIMPTRIIISCWRLLRTRQFKRLSSAELSDLGSFIVLIAGVTLLQQADISLIYHMIRGQGTIKLYVVYNVLEIFDKLCQSFGGDIMQALFNSADGLANCSPENMQFWLWRFISDEALAVASSIVHSFILLAQAITLSTCIVAHNNALFAMLVSNNFSEIKSNVFKRYSKDNVQILVYFDSVERFHISAFILFVLAQNMLEAEGPWFESFLCNAMIVFTCEGMIDIIKHSFIAKFNDIKPIAFSEFLEDLCKQVLNIETENNNKKHLTFLPLAPACVVIRVFRPVYAAHLPHNPLLWRLFWIFVLFLITFVMLASLKVMIGMALRKHAQWYVKRCEKRKLHSD